MPAISLRSGIRTYEPGLRWQGVGNTFRGNKVWEAPHQAVLGGGNEAVCGICSRDSHHNLQCHYGGNGTDKGQSDAACGGNDNLWEDNHFLNLTWETSDSGAFYSCVKQRCFLDLPCCPSR